MTQLGLLWKNAARKPLRFWLTVISVFFAFLIFGVTKSFDNSLDEGMDAASGANRLVTVNKITFIQPLPYSYVNKVAAMDGVADVTYAVWFGAYYQDPQAVLGIFAVEPESYLRIYDELLMDDEVRKKFLSERAVLLVGEKLAERFDWQEGQTVPIQSNIWQDREGGSTWDFEIAGIFTTEDKKIDTSYAIFPFDYLDERRTFGRDTVGWLVIGTESASVNQSVSQAIDYEFSNSPTQTKTDTERAFNQAFLEQFGNISLIVTLVSIAAFFAILWITANTMALSVRERTSEIAVLKTLGFGQGRIFRMVIFEALLITAVGGLSALGVTLLLAKLVNTMMVGVLPAIFLSSSTVVQALGYMAALAMLTGLFPAWNATRVNVVTALGRR